MKQNTSQTLEVYTCSDLSTNESNNQVKMAVWPRKIFVMTGHKIKSEPRKKEKKEIIPVHAWKLQQDL